MFRFRRRPVHLYEYERGRRFGVSFGTYQLIINAVILLYVVIVAHQGLVGVGTVFNMAASVTAVSYSAAC